MRTTACAAVSAMGLVFATPAVAQSADQAPPPGTSAAPSVGFGDIIVTARKQAERLVDVPIAITAQTGTDLARAGVTNTQDLGRIVPGLNVQTQGGWVNTNLRGVTTSVTSPGSDNPVALYVDGIYQPGQTAALIDLPDVDRVEVLKGPQGTLFGRNATGGAIQIFTKEPSFTPTGELTTRFGVFGGGSARNSLHLSAQGYVSAPLSDTVAVSLSGNDDWTDGYLTNDVSGKRDGRIHSRLVRGKILWKPSSTFDVLMTGYYSKRNDRLAEAGLPYHGDTAAAYPAYTDAIYGTKPWHTAYDDPTPDYISRSYGGSLRARLKLDIGTITSLTGYTNTRAIENVDVDVASSASCLAAFACANARVTTPERTWSEELNFASRKFGGLSFVAGLFAYDDHARLTNNFYNGGFLSDAMVKTRAYAAFAEATYEITDKLSIVGGLRYSYEKKDAFGGYGGAPRTIHYVDKKYNSVTPRASIRYALDSHSNLYATFSQGFKSGIVASTIFSVPATKPEKITAYEIGYKRGNSWSTINLSGFYYDYKDLQVEFFDARAAGSIPGNAASARIYGLDFDASAKVSNDFTLRAAVTWLPHVKYRDYPNATVYVLPIGPTGLQSVTGYDAGDTRIIKTPDLTSSVTATYSHEFNPGRVSLSGTVYYSSSFPWEVTHRVRQKDYATLAANLSFEPAHAGLKLGIYGRNLTNTKYINGTLLSNIADVVFYAPPREVGATIGYSF